MQVRHSSPQMSLERHLAPPRGQNPHPRHSKTRWLPPAQGSNHRVVVCHLALCQMMDSNQRRQSRRIYSPLPLAARAIWHAPFGALVTLLRVAPTNANRLYKAPSGSYSEQLQLQASTWGCLETNARNKYCSKPEATPTAPRRSPSGAAAHWSPDCRAAWPAPPRHTGGTAGRPRRTCRGLRSRG